MTKTESLKAFDLMLSLLPPAQTYLQAIQDFMDEVRATQEADLFAGCAGMEDCNSAQEWLNYLVTIKNDPNMVPSSVYLAIRNTDQRLVGVIDLRHHIDHPILGTWGGHFGYTVRPSERRKGYGKEMVRLNLDNARHLGLEKVLVTCSTTNLASEKTILACGGMYERTVTMEEEQIKRYWITL